MTQITRYSEPNEWAADIKGNLYLWLMGNETETPFALMEGSGKDDRAVINFDREAALQLIAALAELIAIADKQDK